MALDFCLSWMYYLLTHPLHLVSVVVPFAVGLAYWMSKRTYPVPPNGIIIVTGASSGIGLCSVEYLARKFPFVVYGTVRSEADAKRLEDLQLKNVRVLHLDICDEDSCKQAINQVCAHMEEEKLPLAGIVHNAAVAALLPVEFHPLQHARNLFETNFFGVIRFTQLALPLLRESKGRIVMISSMLSSFASPRSAVYGASKCALDGLADGLRQEVSKFDISVSVVKPGLVFSAMNKKNEKSVDELVASRNEEMKELYAELFSDQEARNFHKLVNKSDSPFCVAKAIGDALTSPEPQTRYYVANVNGVPAVAVEWILWMLNDRLKDLVVENFLL